MWLLQGRLSILDLMHSAGKRSVLVDHSDTLNKCMRGQTAAIVARTNEEVLAKAKAQVRESRLSYTTSTERVVCR